MWRELRLAALAGAPHAFRTPLADWQGDGDREDRWRGILAIPGSHNVVATLDDLPVGLARGVPGDDGVPELHSVFVDPKARGHGVGDLLITEVEAWAATRGATRLRLTVMPANGAAIALYERHGYVLTAEPGDLLPDGVTRELVLAKPIGNGRAHAHGP